MTTLDDPMSLDDALRIIRNVAEHDTRQIPSPAEVAEEMERAMSVIQELATEIMEMHDTIERASRLMAKASRMLEEAGYIVGSDE